MSRRVLLLAALALAAACGGSSKPPPRAAEPPKAAPVAAVRSGEVVVSEWAVRADGSRDRTQTIMKLPKQASITQE